MGLRKPITTFVIACTFLIAAPQGSRAEFLQNANSIDAQTTRNTEKKVGTSLGNEAVERRIAALIPDASRHCLPIVDPHADTLEQRYRDDARTSAQQSLITTLRAIKRSATGAWLVKFAAAQKVTICIDHATTLEAHYRAHLRLLGLSSRLDPASRVVFLAHELAHVPQHPRFSNNRRFSPNDMLLLQRVREAAAEAVATRVLWQLRQQGMTAPWQAKLTTAYHDIATSFEATMADGRGTASELWATRSAFYHWFEATWRPEIYDDLMLKTLARIAKDQMGLIPTSRHLTDRYLRGIGNYAGDDFLIKGDGQTLIGNFQFEGLSAGSQARLDAILAETGFAPSRNLSSLDSATLSAVTPGSSAINDDER